MSTRDRGESLLDAFTSQVNLLESVAAAEGR